MFSARCFVRCFYRGSTQTLICRKARKVILIDWVMLFNVQELAAISNRTRSRRLDLHAPLPRILHRLNVIIWKFFCWLAPFIIRSGPTSNQKFSWRSEGFPNNQEFILLIFDWSSTFDFTEFRLKPAFTSLTTSMGFRKCLEVRTCVLEFFKIGFRSSNYILWFLAEIYCTEYLW